MWGRLEDSIAGLLQEEGVNLHDIPSQSDQLSCICGKWQCRWGSVSNHLCGATASVGPGGFPQCLYMNGVPRGSSYLCLLLLCSFLGLLLAVAKILDNSDCLAGETQDEHLYPFGSTLFVEARETKVRYPIVASKL